MTISDYTERRWRSVVGAVPKVDTSLASPFSSTKLLAESGGFQDVRGELIEVFQDRPAQSPPFISKASLLWKAFGYPTYIDYRSNHIPYFASGRLSLPDCW